MTPEQALAVRDFIVQALEMEAQTTKRVLQAVPEKGNDYRPDPKSRTGLELAWHVAATDVWFVDSILAGSFNPETDQGNAVPANIRSGAQIADYYEKNYIPKIGKLRSLTAEQLTKVTDFFGAFQFPMVTYIHWLNIHSIHHRGQLSSYLRAMGSKVPTIYGGSADEPFQMGASA
jgi:uncharacterized damage-inducible protein DinB